MEDLAFATMLKSWRRKRHISELDLAEEVELSPRHLSFLETGRSRPNRETVLNLASALTLPLRDRNSMLQAAGFQAVYRESDLYSEAMEPIRRTLSTILEKNEPNPTLVMDPLWNVQMANGAARHILDLFTLDRGAFEESPNILRMSLRPDGLRAHVRNFDQVATRILRRLRLDAQASSVGSPIRRLLAEIEGYPGMPIKKTPKSREAPDQPFIPLELEKDGLSLSLFTTITTLGTAQDITLHDLRIETYYPNDEATEAYLQGLQRP